MENGQPFLKLFLKELVSFKSSLSTGKQKSPSLHVVLVARSWLNFFEPDLPVTLVSKDKSTVVMTVKELLPYSFTDLT